MKETYKNVGDNRVVDRRSFLASLGTLAIIPLAPLSMQPEATLANSLTKEQRDSMTPSWIVEELKKGNERFRTRKGISRDYLAQKRSSAAGQYPAAVILGCV